MIVVGKKMVSLVRSSGAHLDGGAWGYRWVLVIKRKTECPLLASEGPSWGSGLGSFEYAWVNNLAGSVMNSLWGQGFCVGQGC